jgi:hypothetical protein
VCGKRTLGTPCTCIGVVGAHREASLPAAELELWQDNLPPLTLLTEISLLIYKQFAAFCRLGCFLFLLYCNPITWFKHKAPENRVKADKLHQGLRVTTKVISVAHEACINWFDLGTSGQGSRRCRLYIRNAAALYPWLDQQFLERLSSAAAASIALHTEQPSFGSLTVA